MKGQTHLVIITAAMRKVQYDIRERELRSSQEKKAKALNGRRILSSSTHLSQPCG